MSIALNVFARVDLTNLLLFRVWLADRQHLCHLEIDRNVAFQVSHPRYRLSRCFSGKETACHSRRHKKSRIHPWVGKIPWRRK